MLKSYEVGEVFTTNNYGDVKVIAVRGSTQVDVEFFNSGNIKTVAAGDLRNGLIADERKFSLRNKFKIGDILDTNNSGKIEVLDIITNGKILVKFLNTGNQKFTNSGLLSTGSVKDIATIKYLSNSVGSKIKTTHHGYVEILEINSSVDITVKFVNTGSIVKTRAYEISTGMIKDPLGTKFTPKSLPSNRFCVYLHKTVTGEVKYVGHGVKVRAHVFTGRTKEWQAAFSNLAPVVEVIEENLEKEQAFDLEFELIQKYKNTVVNKIKVQHKPKEMDYTAFAAEFKYDTSSDTFLSRKLVDGTYVRAGFVTGGYCNVSLDSSTYKVHRVIWLLHNGTIDKNKLIDHIDGNPRNNSIENLREVPRSFNSKNRLGRIPVSGFRNIITEHKGGEILGYRVSWTKDGHDRKSSQTFRKSLYNNSLIESLKAAYLYRESIIQQGELVARIKEDEITIEQAISKLEERL